MCIGGPKLERLVLITGKIDKHKLKRTQEITRQLARFGGVDAFQLFVILLLSL